MDYDRPRSRGGGWPASVARDGLPSLSMSYWDEWSGWRLAYQREGGRIQYSASVFSSYIKRKLQYTAKAQLGILVRARDATRPTTRPNQPTLQIYPNYCNQLGPAWNPPHRCSRSRITRCRNGDPVAPWALGVESGRRHYAGRFPCFSYCWH